MKFQNILRYYRNRSGLNKSELARKVGVTSTYIRNLEAGRGQPPTKEKCLEIAKALRLSEKETEYLVDVAMQEKINAKTLEYVEHIKNKNDFIPVISWVHANQFRTIEDSFPLGVADDYVPRLKKGDNMFALRVKNDCMCNSNEKISFNDGDIIIIDPSADVRSGDFAVIRNSQSQEATFKQYIKKGDSIILHPLNPSYDDIVLNGGSEYEIIGKVITKCVSL